MALRAPFWTLVLLATLVGCLSDEKQVTNLSSSPFRKTTGTQTASFKQAPAATQEVSLRVDRVGKQIVAANARLNQQKIAFITVGVPRLEIFHQAQKDNGVVYITEGLVTQCKTDGELAAALSQELGKLVAEQLAQARPLRNNAARPPLISPRVGNDIGGTFGPADGSEQMMLARFEKDRKNQPEATTAPPPPEMLARIYLQGAGFDAKALDTVAPILRQASKENSVEQTMTGKIGG